MSAQEADPALGFPEGRAIVYCEGAFGTPNGKTAHGLVRFTRRYQVLSVVDSRRAGEDAGAVLDGRPNDIPVLETVGAAIDHATASGNPATHLVIGLAPDGGRLPPPARTHVREALERGLHVDSGLHDFLGDDPELSALAIARELRIRDVRRPPPRDELHFWSGKIAEVTSKRVAVLGTDSAVGKRTTAVRLVQALDALGHRSELIGTGQTAWMQGVRFGIVLDSLINDFLSGEIDYVIWRAWSETNPQVIVLEGQGSLLNPAYPGGYELLAAGRPHGIVLQHAPARREYDGFPGYPIHPLDHQIAALEMIAERPVLAITVNHEGLSVAETRAACADIERATGRPAFDVLLDGAEKLAALVADRLDLGRDTP